MLIPPHVMFKCNQLLLSLLLKTVYVLVTGNWSVSSFFFLFIRNASSVEQGIMTWNIYLLQRPHPIDHSIHCQLYRYYLTSFTTTPPHRPLNTLSAIPWLPDIFYNDPTPWTTQYIVSYTVITWHIVGSDRYIEMTDEKPDFGRGLWEHFRLLTRFDPHQ
jgi:hypothetical protein